MTQWPEDEAAGGLCLCNALQSLALSLFSNAGEDGPTILSRLNPTDDPYCGYDVLQHEIVDLREHGILLPKNTVEATIVTAIETAGEIWTTDAAVLCK